METQDRPEAENAGAAAAEAWKPPRWVKALAAVGFSASFVINLLRGYWVTAAFFVATGLLFLLGARVDDWPKPRRYLFIIVYVAFAVATMVETFWRVRAFL